MLVIKPGAPTTTATKSNMVSREIKSSQNPVNNVCVRLNGCLSVCILESSRAFFVFSSFHSFQSAKNTRSSIALRQREMHLAYLRSGTTCSPFATLALQFVSERDSEVGVFWQVAQIGKR